MLHESIESRYVAQRRTYGRVLRILFGLTGVFWIFIYVIPSVSPEALVRLRAGQTMVYFVLLTVWGLDYLREERRLGVVTRAANSLAIAPRLVTFQDLNTKPSLFTMVFPPAGTSWSVWNVIFGLGLVAGATLMVLQYVRLVSVIVS